MATTSSISSSGVSCEEDPPVMIEDVLIDEMPTRLIKVGGEFSETSNGVFPKVLFLVIPGNPGVAEFYEVFCQTLYKASSYTIPAWAISHAGHSEVPCSLQEKLKATDRDDEVYNLQQQIEHKMAFIEDYIPPGVKLILIGHSVGCYIIVDLIRRMPKLNLLRAVLLFPTVEHIWDTPNGRTIGSMVVYLRWAAIALSYINYYLSDWVKWRLVQWWFRGRKIPDCAFHAIHQLTDPARIHNSMYMAATEMEEILDADYSTIREHLDKFIMYYGSKDNWAPRSHYENMRRRFPEGDVRLCRRGLQHAFCLESSELMADMVWNWTSPSIQEIQ
ncbi:lipid droplet-associated hydrolase-like isoform X1 [Lytechinus pictus]|uniref:lipid droplet-associated hydrolase-like isoform X1 n=1 Tax=Lytechinus pictus TaxID=7653 RepID=UPI0030B9FE65